MNNHPFGPDTLPVRRCVLFENIHEIFMLVSATTFAGSKKEIHCQSGGNGN